MLRYATLEGSVSWITNWIFSVHKGAFKSECVYPENTSGKWNIFTVYHERALCNELFYTIT